MKNFVHNALCIGVMSSAVVSTVSATYCCDPQYEPSGCEWAPCDEYSTCSAPYAIGVDYLYWKTQQDSIAEDATDFTTAAGNLEVEIINPKFKYDSGFRVYGTYELPCDQWGLGCAYTYMPGKGHFEHFVAGSVRETPPDNALFMEPVQIQPKNELASTKRAVSADSISDTVEEIDFGQYSEYFGHWRSKLSYLDVDISRSFKCGACFTLRPHFGFRAMWGHQHTFITRVNPDVPVDVDLEQDLEMDREHYHGYGLEGGLCAEWTLFRNFIVTGHVGGSILHTKITNHNTYLSRQFSGTTSVDIDRSDYRQHFNQDIPTLDYALGVKYIGHFCRCNYSIYAGWESHVWFDLGNPTLIDVGNYSTHGLTVGAEVSF